MPAWATPKGVILSTMGRLTPFFVALMPNPKITLGGKRWRYSRPVKCIVDGKVKDGYCCHDTKTIAVKRDLSGLDELVMNLHEMRHALNDYLDEKYVENESEELGAALDALGYRRLSPADAKALDELRDG